LRSVGAIVKRKAPTGRNI